MAVYAKTIIEVWNGTIYDDISKDVVSEISCTYGIRGNTVNDRVANVGELKFTLRNDTGCIGGVANYYTPNTIGAKENWREGIPVRLKFVYRTETVIKFVGHITELNIDLENKRVEVTARDWMDYAENMPMKLVTYNEDKKIGEVVDLILSGISHQPANKSYATGSNTFTSIFDTVKNRTRALGEFQKLAMSEMGYIYIRQDPYIGETLVVDGMITRNGFPTAIVPDISGYLASEELEDLVTESGDKLVVITQEFASLTNQAYNVEMEQGKRIYNIVNSRYYQRKIDTTAQVLYSIDSPIAIAGNTTIKMEVNYKDSNNVASSVAGKNMVNPVATTDYLMNTLESGSGTDLTSNLTVTADYYVTKIIYTLENTSATAGYITKLQARGYGIYIYNPSDVVYTSLSVNVYGEREIMFDLPYLNSSDRAYYYAENFGLSSDYR